MKILFLCGGSGVGKSTIAFELAKDPKFNLIRSYTDRPKRKQEFDHVFVSEMEMDMLLKQTIVAVTDINGYRYCTRPDNFDEDKINVYVVDSKGMLDTLRFFSNAEVLSVLIEREKVYIDENRKNRSIEIPSSQDVDIVLNNNHKIDICIKTIKTLVDANDGALFQSHDSETIDLRTKIEYHLSKARGHLKMANKYRETLECMQYKE